MKPERITASQFQQAFGSLSDRARREPVVITKHGRDSLVVMTMEEWEQLRRSEPRAESEPESSEESIGPLGDTDAFEESARQKAPAHSDGARFREALLAFPIKIEF